MLIVVIYCNNTEKGGGHVINENEKIEPLGRGINLIVSRQHKLWTDTVLIADFARPGKKDRACDLGTGCGSIPLIWLRSGVPAQIAAVEIQERACDMFRRSLELNGLTDRVQVICSDLRDLNGKLPASYYDLVVCNPPYKADGTGIRSSDSSRLIARHESMCTMDDIAAAASMLLNFSGRFCMCQRPERLSDVIQSMRAHDIEPKRLRFVQQRPSKAPKLFLIEGRKGGRPGGLITEPVLFIEGNNNGFSDEMIKIYGAYKEEYL